MPLSVLFRQHFVRNLRFPPHADQRRGQFNRKRNCKKAVRCSGHVKYHMRTRQMQRHHKNDYHCPHLGARKKVNGNTFKENGRGAGKIQVLIG